MTTRAVTNTLTSTTAEAATLSGCQEYVEVVNHDATNKVYFHMEWGVNSPAPATAVAEADNAYVVLPSQTITFPARSEYLQVNIVGNGGTYTIQSF